MGIFDELFRSLQAQEKVPGISPDFKVNQATPNVYTPPAYPTFSGYPTVQTQQPAQQVPFSPYPGAPTMQDIEAYGRQIYGQRLTTPYTPVSTPVTNRFSQDTIDKLAGAKVSRALNVLDYVREGKRVGLPALTDAKQTFQALNDYSGGLGGDSSGSNSSGPGNSGPGSAGSLGSLGLGLAGLAESVPGFSTAIAGAFGTAMAEAAINANAEADAAIAEANAINSPVSVTMGPFGPVATPVAVATAVPDPQIAVEALNEAENAESEAMGESEGESDSGDSGDGDGDGDGGDGDGGDGDGGDGDGGDGDGGDGGGDGGGGDGGGGGERAGGLIDKQRKAAQAYKRGEITFKELCRILKE
jgi:hypothetical protein